MPITFPFFKPKQKDAVQQGETLAGSAAAVSQHTQPHIPSKEDLDRFSSGLVSIQDIIAPEAIEVDFSYQKINDVFIRTLFIAGYPRTVPANWLSPLINFPHSLDISMHILKQSFHQTNVQ